MNKIKYIFLVGIMGFAASCVDNDINYDFAEEEGLYLNFSLSMPEMQSLQTRGVLDDTSKNPESNSDGFSNFWNNINLYMFIFENQGSPESNYLRSLIHGNEIIPVSTAPEGADDKHPDKVLRKFKAKVDGTSENAIIHLVATNDPNFEEQLLKTTDRSELGLFYGANGLYTQNEYPAFWKRIDLGMPIRNYDEQKDDEKQLKKQLNDKLSHIQMIRNFCRVTVSLTTDPQQIPYLNGFRLLGFTLVNQVDHGYVAAYSESNHSFEEFEAADDGGNLLGKMKDYGEVFVDDGFVPARHPLSVRDHKEEEAASWLPDKGSDDSEIFTESPKYMFERPYQESHRTFVIVKGDFGDNQVRYFKLDIGTAPEWRIDESTGFYPTVFENYHLIRNYSYDIVIRTVADKNVGSDNSRAVVPGPPANNVGASVETQSLQNLSDGVDRMWVSNTKFIIVDNDEGHPVYNGQDVSSNGLQLWWRYVEDIKGTQANVSGNVKHNYPGMKLEPNDDSGIFKDVTEGLNGVPSGKTSDSYGDWLGATITIKNPTDEVKQKTVRLYYSDNSGNVNVRLSRDVTFVMRKRWEFINNPVKPEDMAVEVYPGAYSFEFENGVNPPYETLKEMRENIERGYVGSQVGAQLTVMFELPADLPQSIFPLDFTIGFDRQNVENAYEGNATVVTGNSMFEDEFNDNELNVQRIQFVKTVTWDYYNGDDTKKGHKLVCARFITNNDVLTEPAFDGTTSTTRVRVWNPYFARHKNITAKDYKNCQGKFERASHDNVVDPTRTNYYWNFSYPEWATYFSQYRNHADPDNLYNDFVQIFDNSGYTDDASKNNHWSNWATTHTNPHTLNNLYFTGYRTGGKDDTTNVPGTYLQPVSNWSLNGATDATPRSKTNPEIWFNLNHKSETGFTATLTLATTPHSNRTGSRNDYHYYDRYVYATIITDKHPEGYLPIQDKSEVASDGNKNDLQAQTFTFNVEPNETITRVLIWSDNYPKHTGQSGNYDDPGETRYYAISFTLMPK